MLPTPLLWGHRWFLSLKMNSAELGRPRGVPQTGTTKEGISREWGANTKEEVQHEQRTEEGTVMQGLECNQPALRRSREPAFPGPTLCSHFIVGATF